MAATVPRELMKWIQSLDLTWSVRSPKWDLSNGYLIAEIFSWYYPRELQMNMYHNVSSLKLKLGNWYHLKRFMKRKEIPIPDEYIDGVIHCKEGAAVLLLQALYQILTNRQLKVIPADPEIDFTDHGYQLQLPEHARSTAVQAIRNNLKGSELAVITSIVRRRQLAQDIVNRHTEDRARARLDEPQRYGHQPTLGELAPRHPPPADYSYSFVTDDSQLYKHTEGEGEGDGDGCYIANEQFDQQPRSSINSANVRFRDVPGSNRGDTGTDGHNSRRHSGTSADLGCLGAGDYITAASH